MDCDHETDLNHLHSMGKVKKLDVWIPDDLSQAYKNYRVIAYASFFACYPLTVNQHRPFISRIITGDEFVCL